MPMSIKSWTVSYQDTCVLHGFLKIPYKYEYAYYRSHHYNLKEKSKYKGHTKDSPISFWAHKILTVI